MEDNGSTTKGLLGSSSSDVTAPPKREDETEPDEEDDDDDGDEEDVVVVVVEPDGRDTSGESEEDTNDGTVSSSFGEGNRARFPTATSGGQLTLSSIIRLLLVVYSIHNQSINQRTNQSINAEFQRRRVHAVCQRQFLRRFFPASRRKSRSTVEGGCSLYVYNCVGACVGE